MSAVATAPRARKSFPVVVTNGRLTPEEAADLTVRIRQQVNVVWALVTEAHDRKAWAAMGYTSWRASVVHELRMSESRSYQLIDTGHVMRVAQQVLGDEVSNTLETGVTAREAARAKQHLPALRRTLRAKVKEGLAPDVALREAIKALPAPRRTVLEIAPAPEPVAVIPAQPKPKRSKVPQGTKTCPRCDGLGYI